MSTKKLRIRGVNSLSNPVITIDPLSGYLLVSNYLDSKEGIYLIADKKVS
jgi:hypothetical protein